MAKKKSTGSSSRIRYDYYTVEVPGDIYDPEDPAALESLGHIAIDEAKNRAKLYCMPALWTAECVKGEPGDYSVTFKVRRARGKVAG